MCGPALIGHSWGLSGLSLAILAVWIYSLSTLEMVVMLWKIPEDLLQVVKLSSVTCDPPGANNHVTHVQSHGNLLAFPRVPRVRGFGCGTRHWWLLPGCPTLFVWHQGSSYCLWSQSFCVFTMVWVFFAVKVFATILSQPSTQFWQGEIWVIFSSIIFSSSCRSVCARVWQENHNCGCEIMPLRCHQSCTLEDVFDGL